MRIGLFACLLLLPFLLHSQQITLSEPLREDGRSMNFDIIGKQGKNIIILEKMSWRHALNIFDDSMRIKESIPLEFLPNRVLNIDHVNYSDYFYLIYQYQKKGIVYCMSTRFDGNGKLNGDPVQLDTTQVGTFGDNGVYSVIKSDNRQHILIFKLQKAENGLLFNTMLYNNRMEKQHHSRLVLPFTQQRDIYEDFLLDNEGNLVFVGTRNEARRGYSNTLYLHKKPGRSDELVTHKIKIDSAFLGSIICKADNLNKRYILASFYNTERGGSVDGLFTSVWDMQRDTLLHNTFLPLDDSIRNVAKSGGSSKSIFDDFELRQIVLKKDGSIMILSEFFNTQSNMNQNPFWNRNIFWANGASPYYFYDPYFGNFYRPFNSFFGPGGNNQNIRYYYENVLISGVTASGELEWNTVVSKQQFSDENDNHLSFGTFHSPDGLHILFNDISKRESLMMDNAVTSSGNLRRNPSFKTYEKGVEFMPRYARQVGARQVIVPGILRNQLVFAKIDL